MPGDREATFQLVNGVALLGGFAGIGAPDPDARDVVMFETVLTSDLLRDDGPDFLNNGENSYHVVTATGVDDTAILDGLTITAGNADADGHDDGGGLLGTSGSPTINGCVFRDSFALVQGDGVFNSGSGTGVHVLNTAFEGNRAKSGVGGGMSNFIVGTTLVENCRFVGNVTRFGGGRSA